jgi:predicted transcriptional regulator
VDTVRLQYRQLDARRRELGMPYRALAEFSGVSQPVVQRLLDGKLEAPRFHSVVAIAQALGMRGITFVKDGAIQFGPSLSVQELRAEQAMKKAKRLVGMVQGTSALEGQAVGEGAYQAMVDRTYHELLAGSNHRLWSY